VCRNNLRQDVFATWPPDAQESSGAHPSVTEQQGSGLFFREGDFPKKEFAEKMGKFLEGLIREGGDGGRALLVQEKAATSKKLIILFGAPEYYFSYTPPLRGNYISPHISARMYIGPQHSGIIKSIGKSNQWLR
jgi:hypothetical protein